MGKHQKIQLKNHMWYHSESWLFLVAQNGSCASVIHLYGISKLKLCNNNQPSFSISRLSFKITLLPSTLTRFKIPCLFCVSSKNIIFTMNAWVLAFITCVTVLDFSYAGAILLLCNLQMPFDSSAKKTPKLYSLPHRLIKVPNQTSIFWRIFSPMILAWVFPFVISHIH